MLLRLFYYKSHSFAVFAEKRKKRGYIGAISGVRVPSRWRLAGTPKKKGLREWSPFRRLASYLLLIRCRLLSGRVHYRLCLAPLLLSPRRLGLCSGV
jgi:hypothetical protein